MTPADPRDDWLREPPFDAKHPGVALEPDAGGFSADLFGARSQVVVGVATTVVAVAFWALGTFRIPGAASWPWLWTPAGFIFHASMFFGLVACYSIVATGLGFRATERVESAVTS